MAAIIRFDLDISKMSVQGGGCTTIVMQNEDGWMFELFIDAQP